MEITLEAASQKETTIRHASGSIGGACTPTLTVGPNFNITKTQGIEQETSIVINPTNPSNLFAADTAGGTFKYSIDGGVTWLDSDINGVLGGGSLGDQQEAWDTFGNLFLTYFAGPNSNTAVAVSTDGGKTFQLSLDTGSLQDQPNIAVGAGTVWVDYTGANGRVAQGAAVSGLGQIGAWSAARRRREARAPSAISGSARMAR